MFSNLIESSSHAKEFKRRGSFLLFTTSVYVVLFVITGVISIYAYDARLEQQNLEVVVLLPPQEIAPDPQPVTPADKPKVTKNNDESNVTERMEAMVSVNRPEIPPKDVSVTPNKNPPIPDHGLWRISDRNRDAVGVPPGPVGPGGGGQVVPQRQVMIDEPPPPAAETPKVPKVISKGVITGQAVSLPQPAYPMAAKNIRVQGKVSVQVLIDEQGRVISATAVDGHPLLTGAAQRAALQAKFKPTLLSNQPVKVSGVITYDFKLN